MSALIQKTAENLRAAIERAQNAQAAIPWLKRFPHNCCNFAANLLLIELSNAGVAPLRRLIAGVPEEAGDDTVPHVWVLADGIDADISADAHQQPSVIVQQASVWHESLEDVKPFVPRLDVPEGIAATEITRLKELYANVIPVLAEFREAETLP